MGSFAFRAVFHSGLQNKTIYSAKQTHGWISGAILFGGIHAMRFLFWRRRHSLVLMVLY